MERGQLARVKVDKLNLACMPKQISSETQCMYRCNSGKAAMNMDYVRNGLLLLAACIFLTSCVKAWYFAYLEDVGGKFVTPRNEYEITNPDLLKKVEAAGEEEQPL